MTMRKGKKLRLREIIDTGAEINAQYHDTVVNGITLDSRKVEKGFLFAALKGSHTDGGKFVNDAVEKGAIAILCSQDEDIIIPENICLIKHENPRKLFSLIAAKFYPRQPDIIAAVTGTNGKTSTVHFCREIWKNLGRHAASIGTIGIADSDGKFDYDRSNFLTTPDTVKLHDIIEKLAEKGVTHLAMEASSHGLDQYRLDGIKVNIAAFTNLSRDHLDYHGNFENYLKAKMRLFGEVMQEGGVAVLNSDVPEFETILEVCKKRHHKVISYGRYSPKKKGNHIEIFDVANTSEGMQISFEILGKVYNVNTPLIGEFQAYNLLCALGIAMASGANSDDAVQAMSAVSCVPGRMERVPLKNNNAMAFVDYSHTPDALAKALAVLRPYTTGKLYVVFGCGGDRDRGKRPLMGKVAGELADKVIVTDDNPRSEYPATIRSEVLSGVEGGKAEEIGDRRKAIKKAVACLQKGDVLLVAGKGHEKTQTIGADVLPFDDVEVVKEG